MSSSRAMPARLLAIALALVLSTAAGCGGGDGKDKNPSGAQLLNQAADVMRKVTSLGFTLRTSGEPKVNVKSVDAKLLRNGDSQGSVRVTELGMSIQLDFVLIGQTAHYKGLTGGWRQAPLSEVAGIYDPSAILDPNRGLVRLLLTAKDATTKKREKVAGQDAYRVHATLSGPALARLVPGMSGDAPADIWIAAAGHHVLKTDVQVPPRSGSKPATVTITFADYDKPFTITAPAT